MAPAVPVVTGGKAKAWLHAGRVEHRDSQDVLAFWHSDGHIRCDLVRCRRRRPLLRGRRPPGRNHPVRPLIACYPVGLGPATARRPVANIDGVQRLRPDHRTRLRIVQRQLDRPVVVKWRRPFVCDGGFKMQHTVRNIRRNGYGIDDKAVAHGALQPLRPGSGLRIAVVVGRYPAQLRAVQPANGVFNEIGVHRIAHAVCWRAAGLGFPVSPVVGNLAPDIGRQVALVSRVDLRCAAAMSPHLLLMRPGIPILTEVEILEVLPHVANRHVLVRKGRLEGLPDQRLHGRRGIR